MFFGLRFMYFFAGIRTELLLCFGYEVNLRTSGAIGETLLLSLSYGHLPSILRVCYLFISTNLKLFTTVHASCTVPNYLCGMERDRLGYLIKAGFLKGVVGTFGNWVFRRQHGGHIVYYLKYSGPVSNTPKQQKSRGKFRDAVYYANRAMLIPEIKAAYTAIAKNKKKLNVHLLATQYFLKGIHIPLPLPLTSKYASWEAILQEIHQMRPVLPSKGRRRRRASVVIKPTMPLLPRNVNIAYSKQGTSLGNLDFYNTT